RATEEIPAMIEIIQVLLARGYAYSSNGNIYFSIKQDPEYGGMARAIGLYDYHAMLQIANERGNRPNDPNKKDPLDFLLWHAQVPAEPGWPSTWGPGRPGWHIECSDMSMRDRAPRIDIQGGGIDLAFPDLT